MSNNERILKLGKLIREKNMVDPPYINKIEPEIRTGVQYALPPAMRKKLNPELKEN
ncbi:hypothetical protein P9851_09465 [Geobacillus stearothermophilus]|jgi:hypothetical protein|uniref:hypothetical protein n=1 Tax=Geobacillus TaxID=129337 RepID=UPI000654C9E6|nr:MULTISPECIES: hypothetical protein [Geobacillus]AKM17827.1 hypothetical protein GARCT_00501 [Geobacillus sp. 12AMOR1]MED5077465.1 hypothetical protein [Geobacillus stearothermophilus]STO36518.1 Uncharacterised protein [[Flavobacterium] thermophilum]